MLLVQWTSVVVAVGLALFTVLSQQPFASSDYIGWFLMLGMPTLIEILALVALTRSRYRLVRGLTAALLAIWAIVALMIAMNPVYLAFSDSFSVRLAVWIGVWLIYAIAKARILQAAR